MAIIFRIIFITVGVALVNRHGLAAVLFPHAHQPLHREVKGLVPADGLPVGLAIGQGDAFDGLAQAVRVFVQVFEGHGLGANVTT